MLSILLAAVTAFLLEGRIDTLCRNRLNLLVDNAIVRIQMPDTMKDGLHEGDLVRVSGIKKETDTKVIRFVYHTAKAVEVVRRLPPIAYEPRIVTENANEIRMQPQWTPVRLSGVIESALDSADAEWSWLVIRCNVGTIGAAARKSDYPLPWLQSLVDAEVSLSGLVTRSWGSENSLSSHLSVRGTNSIEVIRPAPTDPFASSAYLDVDAPHRQKISGTVRATGRDRFALISDGGTLLTVFPRAGEPMPKPFQPVTAVGFTCAIPNLTLKNAVIRFDERSMAIDPGEITPHLPNRVPDNPRDQNQLVRFSGIVTGVSIETDGRMFVSTERRTVSIDVSGIMDGNFSPPKIGSVIEATGIAFLDLAPPSPAESFTHILGVTVAPRFASDVKVISAPPWWTPGKFILLLATAFAVFVASLATIHVRNRRRTLFEKCLAEVKVKERTRLAVELHDSFSQTLTGVQMELQAATRKLNDKRSATLFDTARQMLDSCHRELRNSLWDLRSRTFEEMDMNEAVFRTIAPHLGNAKAIIRFNVRRDALSDSSAHTLLRTIRELVVNAVRHGNASMIRIAGELIDGRARFSVRDNGCGFDQESSPGPDEGHFGLSGIRERIDELNGTMEICSTCGGGTRITIAFDVRNGGNT